MLQGDDEPLPLTGPYTAISAYGSFTFRVEIGGPEAQDDGELDWDCYDEENKYDEPVAGTITTNKCNRKVHVTYAVLSEAVEVNVEVHLLLPPGAASAVSRVIYGEIATRSQSFNGDERAWSVLFDSMRNGVEITYGPAGGSGSDSGSMASIPLARSVVAMPLGSPLVVKATLYDAPPSQEDASPFFQRQDIELTLGDRTKRFPIQNGGAVQVKITSPDLRCPAGGPSDTTTTTPISGGCAKPSCPYF